jgi:RHS repeat-associated protein
MNFGLTQMLYGYDALNKRFFSWNTAWTDTMGYGNADGWQVAIYSPSGKRLETIQMNVTSGGSGAGFYLSLASTLLSSDTYFGGHRLAPQDRLGSVGKYYPYGEDKSTSNPTGDTWKFGTYWRDSFSSLDYADQRYYNNSLGRFMTSDPYAKSAGTRNPQSWNRYAYVLGDPTNHLDPRGLCSEDDDYSDCDDTPDDDGGDPEQAGRSQDGGGPGDSGTPSSCPSGMVPYTGGCSYPSDVTFTDDASAQKNDTPPDDPPVPVPVPPGQSSPPWVFVPNLNPTPGQRPGRWKPMQPIPGQSQPCASWDPKCQHWDVDDGRGNRTRYLPDGTEVDHDGRPVKYITIGTVGAILYWIISEGSRIAFPPRNLIPVP